MSAKSKAINVKIPTVKIIAALEQALNKLELDYASQEERETKHQLEYDAWRAEMTKILMANADKGTNVRINYRSWQNTVNIDYDINTNDITIPEEPVKKYEKINQHEYRSMQEEIGNAVRILKMTDEEVVSTSTYNSVAKYL